MRGDPEAAVRELIEAANGAGGKDNVTVLMVEGEQFTAPAGARAAASGPWVSRALLFAAVIFAAALAAGAGSYADDVAARAGGDRAARRSR